MQQPPKRGHYHRPILTRTKASAATTDDDDDEEEGVNGEFLPLWGKNGILWEFLLEGWGCRW